MFKSKIVIEIDGSQHFTDEGLNYNEYRTSIINEFDIDVIRFSNYDVNTNFEGVCMAIDKTISQKLGVDMMVFNPAVTLWHLPFQGRQEIIGCNFMKKIMFICSGNTCRSPLAEGLFKKYLKENNISDIAVGSAGVAAFPGDEVSINSLLVAGNRGIDIFSHRARNINPEHLLTTDLFCCMSDSHKQVLLRHCDENKIMVLNVPDPYGRPIEAYEECAKQLESKFPEILQKIQNTTVVREMQESDIKEIAELEKECFSDPWSENSLRDELTNETARFYVFRDDEKLLGYIGSNNICNQVYITNVAVNEKSRGKGYGKILVNHLIKQSELENAFFITLEVRKSNENAIKLYEKCGFIKIGERKNFYSKPQEDALIYTYYFE